MYNLSKFYGIPCSYKTALKVIKEIARKEKENYHDSGYLAIVKKEYSGGYTGKVVAYPIFYYVNKPRNALKIIKI